MGENMKMTSFGVLIKKRKKRINLGSIQKHKVLPSSDCLSSVQTAALKCSEVTDTFVFEFAVPITLMTGVEKRDNPLLSLFLHL